MTLYDLISPLLFSYHRETADDPSRWRKLGGNHFSDSVPIKYKFRTSPWFPCCLACLPNLPASCLPGPNSTWRIFRNLLVIFLISHVVMHGTIVIRELAKMTRQGTLGSLTVISAHYPASSQHSYMLSVPLQYVSKKYWKAMTTSHAREWLLSANVLTARAENETCHRIPLYG